MRHFLAISCSAAPASAPSRHHHPATARSGCPHTLNLLLLHPLPAYACSAHKRAKEASVRASSGGDPCGVPAGTWVQLRVAAVPADAAQRVVERVAASRQQEGVAPLVVFGLLHHECKLSVQVGRWVGGRHTALLAVRACCACLPRLLAAPACRKCLPCLLPASLLCCAYLLRLCRRGGGMALHRSLHLPTNAAALFAPLPLPSPPTCSTTACAKRRTTRVLCPPTPHFLLTYSC